MGYDTTPFKTISDDTINIKAELESGVLPLSLIPNTLTGKSAQYVGGHSSSEFLLLSGGTMSGALTINAALYASGTITTNSGVLASYAMVPMVCTNALTTTAVNRVAALSASAFTLESNIKLVCNSSAEAALSTGQARNVYISNQDPSSSVGNIGEIWFKYA